MVVLGGLELVAAGYLIHQYEENKKEKRRLEGERRRRRRRPHSESPPRYRPPRRDDRPKYEYRPSNRPSASAPPPAKPSVRPPGSGGRTSSNNLAIPGPSGPQRPSCQPAPRYRPAAGYTAPAMMGHGPYPQPPPSGPPGNYPYSYPPRISSPAHLSAASNAPRPPAGPSQGAFNSPYTGPEKFTYNPEVDDPRRHSDTSLPLGIYEPSDGVYELAAEGPWMHDQQLTVHQRPHVRFNIPGEGITNTVGGEEPRSPPPAYRP